MAAMEGDWDWIFDPEANRNCFRERIGGMGVFFLKCMISFSTLGLDSSRMESTFFFSRTRKGGKEIFESQKFSTLNILFIFSVFRHPRCAKRSRDHFTPTNPHTPPDPPPILSISTSRSRSRVTLQRTQRLRISHFALFSSPFSSPFPSLIFCLVISALYEHGHCHFSSHFLAVEFFGTRVLDASFWELVSKGI